MIPGWAIFDQGQGMAKRMCERLITNKIQGALAPDPGPRPKVIRRNFGGDPFSTLIDFEGRYYILDEAAVIEEEERAMGALFDDTA